MDQAVTSFRDLLAPRPGEEPGEAQRRAAASLPERLMRSHMDWWPLDATPTGSGTRLLIGVAVWSTYDLRLLDVLEGAIHAGRGKDVQVGVFDVDRLAAADELQRLLPGVGTVTQTPVVGVWTAGELKQVASGFAGRQLVAQMFGLDHNAIVERPATPR